MEEYVLSSDNPLLDEKVHEVLNDQLTFEGFQAWLIDSDTMIDERLFHYLDQHAPTKKRKRNEEDELIEREL